MTGQTADAVAMRNDTLATRGVLDGDIVEVSLVHSSD